MMEYFGTKHIVGIASITMLFGLIGSAECRPGASWPEPCGSHGAKAGEYAEDFGEHRSVRHGRHCQAIANTSHAQPRGWVERDSNTRVHAAERFVPCDYQSAAQGRER